MFLKIIFTIFIWLLLSALIYGAFSFGYWSLDPTKWDIDGRAFASFFVLIALAVTIVGIVPEFFNSNSELSIADSMEVITKEFNKDQSEGSYYHSWQTNMAVTFQDEFNATVTKNKISQNILHGISNRAAIRFLDMLRKEKESDEVMY